MLEIVDPRGGEGRAGRGDRAAWRADPAEACRRACKRRASRSSAPARTRSTWPRIASASRRWSTGCACKQPENGIARSREEALKVAERIGYPVLLRPSYVLGGRAMEIVDGPAQLEDYIATAVQVSGDEPGAGRPISARRDRGRRRRDLRRHGRRGRRRAGAYRGGGGPFGRQRLLDPAAQPVARDHRRDRASRPGRWRWRSRSRG